MVGAPARLGDQAEVAGVQIAHGRDQADAPRRTARGSLGPGPHGGDMLVMVSMSASSVSLAAPFQPSAASLSSRRTLASEWKECASFGKLPLRTSAA